MRCEDGGARQSDICGGKRWKHPPPACPSWAALLARLDALAREAVGARVVAGGDADHLQSLGPPDVASRAQTSA